MAEPLTSCHERSDDRSSGAPSGKRSWASKQRDKTTGPQLARGAQMAHQALVGESMLSKLEMSARPTVNLRIGGGTTAIKREINRMVATDLLSPQILKPRRPSGRTREFVASPQAERSSSHIGQGSIGRTLVCPYPHRAHPKPSCMAYVALPTPDTIMLSILRTPHTLDNSMFRQEVRVLLRMLGTGRRVPHCRRWYSHRVMGMGSPQGRCQTKPSWIAG